jgi:RecB family exonuclease
LQAPGLPLAGRIDRVEFTDRGVQIIDLKTGTDPAGGMRPEHRRQLLLYAYLWAKTRGEWPTKAAIESLGGRRTYF